MVANMYGTGAHTQKVKHGSANAIKLYKLVVYCKATLEVHI